MADMLRDTTAIVRDVTDGTLMAHSAVRELGEDLTRLREAFTMVCARFHRSVQMNAILEDENTRLRRTSPTAVYARRCFWLGLVCFLLSAATQAIVLLR